MAHADDEKPFGPIDPNSQHQLWSHWTFTVYEGGRHAPYADVALNAARWLRAKFGSVARARVEEKLLIQRGISQKYYVIEAQVEGVPAHDPQLVTSVRQSFARDFVFRGWGPLATSDVTAKVMAGSKQDGKPAAQLVVMPRVVGDK